MNDKIFVYVVYRTEQVEGESISSIIHCTDSFAYAIHYAVEQEKMILENTIYKKVHEYIIEHAGIYSSEFTDEFQTRKVFVQISKSEFHKDSYKE